MTKIEFSPFMQKKEENGEHQGKYMYRVKIINSKWNDLNEVSFLVKLSLKIENGINYTYLGMGKGNMLGVLRGKKYQLSNNTKRTSHVLSIYLTKNAFQEFRKSIYTDFIINKANKETLVLEDILHEYGSIATITVFIFGNDSLTGARKMFSKSYVLNNIKEGTYNTQELPVKRKGYRREIKKALDMKVIALVENEEKETGCEETSVKD
jgi:hypothetical protein